MAGPQVLYSPAMWSPPTHPPEGPDTRAAPDGTQMVHGRQRIHRRRLSFPARTDTPEASPGTEKFSGAVFGRRGPEPGHQEGDAEDCGDHQQGGAGAQIDPLEEEHLQ